MSIPEVRGGIPEGSIPDFETAWWSGPRARVFISCGQEDKELETADRIADTLWKMGYCPHVARRSRSSDGLKEAIFRRLRSAEYFLFIDFPREKLSRDMQKPDAAGPARRGSLFSHQELAIAVFLDLKVLPIQHESLSREGILGVIQGNAAQFSDSTDLRSLVVEEIHRTGWRPDWRNELEVGAEPARSGPALNPQVGECYYFHLNLTNLHYSVAATDIRVFAERVKSPGDPEWRKLPPIELKNRYLRTESGTIVPKQTRQVDAAIVPILHPDVAIIGFNLFLVDAQEIANHYQLRGVGDHTIEFSVHSREFRPSRFRMVLTLSNRIDGVSLRTSRNEADEGEN
jgi:hypothetical protein